MPRRNLEGNWGANPAISVRLGVKERGALRDLCERWGCTDSEAIRRAIRAAARRSKPGATRDPESA